MAGEHLLATLDVGDGRLSMAFAGALPEPVLSGHEATYREVYPGVDLVLAATGTGFEQSFVVKSREAATRVASFTVPLQSKRLRFVADGPGSFAIRDARGATVGRVPTPTMWDSQRGPDGTKTREKATDLFFGKATYFTAQAYVQWPTEQFGGAFIRSATPHLWNYYSASCGPAGWQAFVSAPYTNPITWDARPAFVAAGRYSEETRGLTSTLNKKRCR